MNLLKKLSGGNGHGELAATRNPFAALQNEVDHMFDKAWKSFENGRLAVAGQGAAWPAIDVTEDEKAVTVRADVPGMDAKDVEVEVSGNVLTIRGSREEEHKEEKKGYRYSERRSGKFSRSIELPTYADASKIDARYDKGVLVVTAPKIASEAPKQVKIKST